MFDSNSQSKKIPQIRVAQSQIRILLWDIDGTLMRSTVQGGYKKYFSATMRKVFGSAGNLDALVPSGMTDTQIMYEALKSEGFAPEQIFERKDDVLKIFKEEMTAVLAKNGEPYEMLDGADRILAAAAENPRYINSLLTGNLSVAAQIKLRSINLWKHFADAPNAFGEISHDRRDLATEAGKLFNRAYDFNFAPEQFIVIGDTPNDVACARHFGAKSVAVLTGKNQTREKLAACQPDVIVDDLSDTQQLLEIFDKL